MTVSKKLIENVGELKKALNEISVYDFDVYTSMELYYKIAEKLNEVIKELSRFEGAISDEVVQQNEKLLYLLGEGLTEEVVKKINQMVQDGTMDSIINHNVFNSLNLKIKENKNNLETLKAEKYLFFGDSYGEGYTPEGNVTSWCTYVKNLLHISDDDYFAFVKGGYGFTNNGFLELLNKSIAAINDKEKVKYIVIGGGYNDAKTYDKIGEKMSEFINICKENYPNAKIIIAPFGWCVEGLTTGYHKDQKITNLINMVLEYQRQAVICGVAYIDGIYSVLHRNRFFCSDYVHPNSNGQYAIGLAVANYLKGGGFNTVEYMYNENCFEDMDYADNVSNISIKCEVTVEQKNTILNLSDGAINCNFDNLVLNGNKILLGTIKNAAVHGYYSKTFFNASAVLKTLENNYLDVNMTLIIYQNKLYMKISKINKEGNNFENTSVKQLKIYNNPTPVTINSLIN